MQPIPTENLQSTATANNAAARKNHNNRAADSRPATEAYKSLKPKDAARSKLMEPVRTNTRQTDESGRTSKKASSRRNSAVLTASAKVTRTKTMTKVVNRKVVSQETTVKQSTMRNSLTVTNQKSSTRMQSNRKSVSKP